MPSPLGHTLIGLGLAHAVYRENLFRPQRRPILILVAVGSLLPDFDLLLVLIYGNPYLHRGLSHSLFFAITVGMAVRVFGRITGRASGRTALLTALLVMGHMGADILVSPGILPMPIRPFYPWGSSANSPFFLFGNITWLKWNLLFSWNTVTAVIREAGIAGLFFLVVSRISGVRLVVRPSIQAPPPEACTVRKPEEME